MIDFRKDLNGIATEIRRPAFTESKVLGQIVQVPGTKFERFAEVLFQFGEFSMAPARQDHATNLRRNDEPFEQQVDMQ